MTFTEFQQSLNLIGYDFVYEPRLNRIKIYPNSNEFIGSAVFVLLSKLGCKDYFVNCVHYEVCLICDLDNIEL